jgi:hypothetical protein
MENFVLLGNWFITWCIIVGLYKTLDWTVDTLWGEKYTPYDTRLGLWGRLTYDRLWTDDPALARIDEEITMAWQGYPEEELILRPYLPKVRAHRLRVV